VILLDTHVVLWLVLEPERISRPASSAIKRARDAGTALCISCISLYEIARLSERRQIELESPTGIFLERISSLFSVMGLSLQIALAASELPKSFPGDPADRIIVGTARVERLRLITADKRIHHTATVDAIW
jgi:PIN domain nuclease of toxin-antitoxin system